MFDPVKAAVFDFADSGAGRHVHAFLGTDQHGGGWRGTAVCGDYAAHMSLFGARVT